MPGEFYAEVSYRCANGFDFDNIERVANSKSSEKFNKLYCSEGRWEGRIPECVEVRKGNNNDEMSSNCPIEEETRLNCDHSCVVVQNDAGRSSASCKCHVGYILSDEDLRTCLDVDECLENNGGCDQVCTNKPGTHMCECNNGFTKTTENGYCVDINECALNNGHGPCQDTCINSEGSYACSCEGIPGTILSRSDKHSCEDMNGCLNSNGGCSHRCIDSYGQVFCLCPDGYLLDNKDWKTCNDIDECKNPEKHNVNCSNETQECVNTLGGSYCRCKNGFKKEKNGSTTESQCIDIDECKDDNFGCSHTCINVFGGAHCLCPYGYKLEDEDPFKECVDINECMEDNGGCEQTCINLEGSLKCGCQAGYTLDHVDNSTCHDTNECDEIPNLCGDHGDCLNTPGYFKCKCHTGFEIDDTGESCVDIDECKEDHDDISRSICGNGGTCVNLDGGFDCECPLGFVFTTDTTQDANMFNSTSLKGCVDIDECSLYFNPCGQGRGICTNKVLIV